MPSPPASRRSPGPPADDAGVKDVSAAWAVTNGEVKAIADWFQRELEGATYSTEALSGRPRTGASSSIRWARRAASRDGRGADGRPDVDHREVRRRLPERLTRAA